MEGVRKEIGQECMTCGSRVHGWNDLQDSCIISNLLSFLLHVRRLYIEESLHLTLEAIETAVGPLEISIKTYSYVRWR